MRKRKKKERGGRKQVNRVKERGNKEGRRDWDRGERRGGNAKSVNVGFKYFMPLSHN